MTALAPANRVSPYWSLVAPLRLKLRSHIRLIRQVVRGKTWYTLHDPAGGRYYRFSPEAHLVIGLLDGRASVGEIMELARARLGPDAPSPDEVLRLLTLLHNADVLQGELPPDLDELTGRAARTRRLLSIQRLKSPLAVRIPLIDPSGFLDRTRFIGRFLFSRLGFAVWLAVVLYAGFQAGARWSELTGNLADRVLAAERIAAFRGDGHRQQSRDRERQRLVRKGCKQQRATLALLHMSNVALVDLDNDSIAVERSEREQGVALLYRATKRLTVVPVDHLGVEWRFDLGPLDLLLEQADLGRRLGDLGIQHLHRRELVLCNRTLLLLEELLASHHPSVPLECQVALVEPRQDRALRDAIPRSSQSLSEKSSKWSGGSALDEALEPGIT
jgi:hypothetical protein